MDRMNQKGWRYYGLIFGGITLILFMHLYRLTEVPYGLHVDEAGAAYDAFSISVYGVDRWLDSYPIYFTNYGDGQNALYTYMMVVLFKIFGVSKIMMRAGIVMAACVAACFGFLYADRRWKGSSVGVVLLYLYAITPIFVMTQRFGLESHLMLAAAVVSLFFMAVALENEKWYFWFFAGLAMGVTLYTYALAYIVVPAFVFFMFLYALRLKKLKMKNVVALLIPLACLAMPLVLVQLVNFFQLSEFKIGPFTVTRLNRYRVNELSVSAGSIFSNLGIMLKNTFLFDDLAYNTIPRFGTMYYISVPFILIGVGKGIAETVSSIKNRVFHYSVPMLAWLLSEWIMGSLLVGNSTPNTTRMIGVFMPYLYFLVSGLWACHECFKRHWLKGVYKIVLGAVYAIGFISFGTYYFTDYNQDAFPMNWLVYEPYVEVREFLEENAESTWRNRDTCYPWNYVYYMLTFRTNPYEMNIPENGIEHFGRDWVNGYPATLQLSSNYVVYKTDASSIDSLQSKGYIKHNLGNFIFFISPLDNYSESQNFQVLGALDGIKESGENICLSGWWIDEETDLPYASLQLQVDGNYINVEIIERPDVVAAYGKEQYLRSGYSAELPEDTFCDANSVVLTGVTEEGGTVVIYEILRQDGQDFLDN